MVLDIVRGIYAKSFDVSRGFFIASVHQRSEEYALPGRRARQNLPSKIETMIVATPTIVATMPKTMLMINSACILQKLMPTVDEALRNVQS